MTIPPRGTILRDMAELDVRWRQLGRAIRVEPPVSWAIATVQRLPWWTFNGVAFTFMGWALWYGDPGWMLAAALYALWGVWRPQRT